MKWKARLQSQAEAHQTQARMFQAQQQHAQQVVQTEQAHQQKMRHAEQQAAI
jgi:hypothetical protein